MPRFSSTTSLFILTFGICFCASAQPDAGSDTTPQFTRMEQDLSVPLYRGKAYHGYPSSYQGSATFLGEDFRTGSVEYRNVKYNDVEITYDAYLERVVINHPRFLYPVQLEPSWVGSFTIGEHGFVAIKHPELEIDGHLEVLVKTADTRLLVEHRKLLAKQAGARELLRSFRDETRYFLEYRGKLHLIENRRDLYKAAPEYKKQLKSFYKEENLSLKKKKRSGLKAMVFQLQNLMNS